MSNKSRVTLRDLAERLKLSPATVSRALNGFPEVGSRTRARVVEIANKMGYEPDRNAQRLAQGNAGAFGMILSSESGRNLEPIFGEFVGGIMEYITDKNLDVLLTPARQKNELDAYRKLINQRAVDGFIITSPKCKDPRVELLSSLNVPFIVHGRTELDSPYNWLDIDNINGFFKATNLLIEYGHTNIALISGQQTMTFAKHRYMGYLQSFNKHGLQPNPKLHIEQPMTEALAYQNTLQLLEQDERPSAFLCSSIFIALGVLRACRHKGLSYPKDFSLITHDDRAPYIQAEFFSPPLTMLQSSIRKAGERCAELLHQQQQKPHKHFVTEQWPVELIAGESVGPAPKL